jgi:hypothetical protein
MKLLQDAMHNEGVLRAIKASEQMLLQCTRILLREGNAICSPFGRSLTYADNLLHAGWESPDLATIADALRALRFHATSTTYNLASSAVLVLLGMNGPT